VRIRLINQMIDPNPNQSCADVSITITPIDLVVEGSTASQAQS
jgi:hypothetical protein